MMDELWDSLITSNKDLFAKICRRLLKQTFIVREKDDESKKQYFFVSNNRELFETYFDYIGFEVFIDKENGVIMLQNGSQDNLQVNHLALKKAESIVLCCLWCMYADRLRKGSLQKTIVIPFRDLQFELEKYQIKDSYNASLMSDCLKLFEKYNLIYVNGKVGDDDCTIALYPSLQFALDGEDFQKFAATTEKRMKTSEGQQQEDLEDEDDE